MNNTIDFAAKTEVTAPDNCDWVRLVKSIDVGATSAMGWRGSFLDRGRVTSIPIASLILSLEKRGPKNRPDKIVKAQVFIAFPNGMLGLLASIVTGGSDWSDALRPTAVRVLAMPPRERVAATLDGVVSAWEQQAEELQFLSKQDDIDRLAKIREQLADSVLWRREWFDGVDLTPKDLAMASLRKALMQVRSGELLRDHAITPDELYQLALNC